MCAACIPDFLPPAEQPKKGAVCQVPGCDRSLHKLRDYYKASGSCGVPPDGV